MARDLSKGKSANMIADIASKSREESGKKTIKNISLDLIDMSEDNDKIFNCDDLNSLVDAINRNGFQGTIEVFLKKDGRYGLLSGHRRYLSAQKVGMKEIPCEIVEEPNEVQKAEILIMSNIVARELTPIEKGKALAYYEEKVLKHDKSVTGDKRAELARRFGIASSQVYKLKALLNLIPELQKLINDETVAYVHIYNCATLSEEVQKRIYDDICDVLSFNGEISGKAVVDIVEKYTKPKKEVKNVNEEVSFDEGVKDTSIVVEDSDEVEAVGDMPLSFMNTTTVEPANTPDYDEVVKSKPEKAMLYNEKRVFIGSQNLRYLLKQLVGNDKVKLKSEEVIEELQELKTLLNELF
ncbi:MAG: ParB/RepB/Spo0J family partition protein [Lachnospiraceae bacterium]|nr:ParB/RepB/Spo0J family partition protein [Lachnospiraceae bacterium]